MVDGKNEMSINRNAVGDFVKATIGAINLSLLSTQTFITEEKQGLINNCYHIKEFNWGYLVAIMVLILLMVKIMPFTRSYENVWVFFLTFISFLLVNIKVAFLLGKMMFSYNNKLERLIWRVVLGIILVSVEEIIMAIFTRFIWKTQVEFKDNEDKGYMQMCRDFDEHGELELTCDNASSDSEDDCYIEFLRRPN